MFLCTAVLDISLAVDVWMLAMFRKLFVILVVPLPVSHDTSIMCPCVGYA